MKDEVEKSNEKSFKFLILDCIINGKQKASNKFEKKKYKEGKPASRDEMNLRKQNY